MHIKKLNIATLHLTWEMKSHGVHIILVANDNHSDIGSFLKVTRFFVFKVWNELEAFGWERVIRSLEHETF